MFLKKLALILILSVANVVFAQEQVPFWQRLPFLKPEVSFQEFKDEFTKIISIEDDFPKLIKIKNKNYTFEYSLKPDLEKYVWDRLKSYRSDFASIVIMDNETGKILAALSHERGQSRPQRLSTLMPTHPAASVFKIITAADLLENTHVSQNTEFRYAGRSTTLYKYQLKSVPPKRYSRKIDFEHAFASSNNVIFGKAAIENLSPTGLKKMAEKFGFNRQLLPLNDDKASVFPLAIDQYNLAELASGLNVKTLISPVHGALIASVISNGGKLIYPTLIERIKDERGELIWESPPQEEKVINNETADYLRKLMIATVEDGTARRAFRKKGKTLSEIEIGGKTGSITGGIPYGKRDWFVAYAKESNNPNDKGISLCVMIVNKKKWYVKSTVLTKELIEFYYNNIKE